MSSFSINHLNFYFFLAYLIQIIFLAGDDTVFPMYVDRLSVKCSMLPSQCDTLGSILFWSKDSNFKIQLFPYLVL